MLDLITMGSATIDAFAETESELIEIKTKTTDEELIAYPLGSKIIITELRYNIGGNGANVAAGASKLGLKTGFVGKIGDDANGKAIMKGLEDRGIEFLGVLGGQSAVSIILDSALGHDRTILTYKGDANSLKFSELKKKNLKARCFYLSSMLGESYKTMAKIAEAAQKAGSIIAFNPSATISKKGKTFLDPVLEHTDVLLLNDEEAGHIVGEGSPEENLRKLHNIGIPKVVITLGDKGAIGTDGKNIYEAEPSPNRKIIETTGAGDALSSGFMTGQIMGKSFEDSLLMGMLNAESVISHPGAQNKLLTLKEMERKLKKDKRVMKKISSVK